MDVEIQSSLYGFVQVEVCRQFGEDSAKNTVISVFFFKYTFIVDFICNRAITVIKD